MRGIHAWKEAKTIYDWPGTGSDEKFRLDVFRVPWIFRSGVIDFGTRVASPLSWLKNFML
jgi:hypothetical protein